VALLEFSSLSLDIRILRGEGVYPGGVITQLPDFLDHFFPGIMVGEDIEHSDFTADIS
jgi:hypothetical protein